MQSSQWGFVLEKSAALFLESAGRGIPSLFNVSDHSERSAHPIRDKVIARFFFSFLPRRTERSFSSTSLAKSERNKVMQCCNNTIHKFS